MRMKTLNVIESFQKLFSYKDKNGRQLALHYHLKQIFLGKHFVKNSKHNFQFLPETFISN